MSAKRTLPPDQPARASIVSDLGTTFLVEAGAGSGKTKSLVDRMIVLLGSGGATVDTLAALTFTRKAAAELRGRFQVSLERARLAEKDAAVRDRLDAALTGLERSFIGTIHSFCARLLRERPVEAGVDPDFRELEEYEDRILLGASWDEYLAKARLDNETALRGLDEAGLDPSELETAFKAIAAFPEVEPVAGRDEAPSFGTVRTGLEKLLELAQKLVPSERPEKGRDTLQTVLVRALRRKRILGFEDKRRLMETVELFDKTLGVRKDRWAIEKRIDKMLAGKDVDCTKAEKAAGKKLAGEAAETMLAAAVSFQEKIALPALREWREFRHTKALAFLRPAVDYYAEKRRAEGRLNFQDQLMLTAKLLREKRQVRAYFRKRFHPILVDEFQDTDPIQAEILFFLTSEGNDEGDWSRLIPAPGSLFLVGDPKQSIYRFRRADIDIYNLVKRRIEESGGRVLELSANFRSLRSIADWVNPVFDPERGGLFPQNASAYQAGFMALDTMRERGLHSLSGVFKVTVPAVPRHSKEPIADHDSRRLAEFIAWALAGNLMLEDRGGGSRPAEPGDFLVLFRYKDRMNRYARRLEEKDIPFEIAGSDAFADNGEIGEVMNLLRALDDPDDPVATVAVLRGLFFGLSDQDLLTHRATGGGFCYADPVCGERGLERVRRTFGVLQAWREITAKVPPSAALEMILQRSGLLNHLATAEMGSSRAGNVLKLVEALRGRESEDMTSFAAAVEFMEEWVGAQPVEEMSLTPGRRNAVRLMNLHKAKGLEAPVVWLANPAGVHDFEPDKHIRRAGANGKPRGHFRFTKPIGFQTKTLSQPVGWEESAAEEKRYEEAEENRLMYVAATRARDLLVVSAYAGDLGERKAWGPLEKGLEGIPELPEYPPAGRGEAARPAPRVRKTDIVRPDEAMKARAALQRTLAAASEAGALHETVTSTARRDLEPPEWAKGGLGRWGSEVHIMLKTLGESWPSAGGGKPGAIVGEADLARMARDVLVAADRNPTDSRDLAGHVAAIVRSEFWGRAMSAGRKYFEVPFSVRVGPEDVEYAELVSRAGLVPLAGGRPVVLVPGALVFLSGAVDLLFKEKDGWVIADYKTDRIPDAALDKGAEEAKKALDALVEYYRPQVQLYSRFWEKITGEKVKESGLYFTAHDAWFKVETP
ncbi:MAG: UvrD-helicase domain-containing protein [Candidatus Aminicenantes bacterium]|nr:UvrD-helicase domain-containing protein [Candidatus Aminicenantes bacterium]